MLRTSFKKPIFDLQTPTVTLTFEERTWVIHATHCLIMVNDSAKLFQIQCMQKEVMLRTSFKNPFFTFKLQLCPWPLRYGPGSYTRHTASSWWTIVPSYLKFNPCIKELCSAQALKSPILTFKLQLWPWPLRYGPGSCTRHTVSSW